MERENSKRRFLQDDEVEEEIARLSESEAVSLARYERRAKYKRRQYLYQLRDLEKRGQRLLDAGITREMITDYYNTEEEYDDVT